MAHVSVVGGGLGGLCGAVYLKSYGFDVDLYEQNSSLGGKMNQIRLGDYRFDTGPSLMTLPSVLTDIFRDVGGVVPPIEWTRIDPICRYFFPDGTRLDTFSDASEMSRELAHVFSEKEVDGFRRFMKYSERIYALTSRIFLYTPIHELNRVLTLQNLTTLAHIFQIDPLRTVHQGVSRFFADPRLVQLFDRYATYNGSDPFQAPATLNIIPHVEFGIGGYYIHGGMYRLVETLTDLAAEMGVRIHTRQRVQKILHTGKCVTGLRVDNQSLATDAVLCNSDVVTTFSSLIEGFPQVERNLNALEPSLSGLVFLWGIDQTTPQWAHHNILFSSDYRREFEQIFTDHSMPDDPTIYISITSKTDSDHAPKGKENWFVLVNAPYLSENQDWEVWIQQTRERVIRKIESVLGTSIADKIDMEETITPHDFLLKYGSNKGSLYGISSNSRTTAFRRPANRNRQVRGLYFAGGSAHPGGGVPLVLLSGKMAAELINQYQNA